MKIALVRQQLRRRHVLSGDRIMGGVGNRGIAMGVIMGFRQKRADICKDRFADFDGVRCRREIGNRNLTEIGRKDERIVTHGRRVACGLN